MLIVPTVSEPLFVKKEILCRVHELMKMIRTVKELEGNYLGLYQNTNICLVGLKKTTMKFSEERLSSSLDSNLELKEYKANYITSFSLGMFTEHVGLSNRLECQTCFLD
jgi:hypothetical protein